MLEWLTAVGELKELEDLAVKVAAKEARDDREKLRVEKEQAVLLEKEQEKIHALRERDQQLALDKQAQLLSDAGKRESTLQGATTA